MSTTMHGAKEFILVCVVFLVISCLTSAQPVSNGETNVYDELRKKEQPGNVEQFHSETLVSKPRQERSLRSNFDKVDRKAIRSPSLRLRFGRRSDPDFPPNFDLLNEEFQQEPNNQQRMLLPLEYAGANSLLQHQQQKRFMGFAREERKPARLRWGRSAPGEFSSARDQVMDTLEALARAQRSKQSRLRWGRSGPMTYNNDYKDLSNSELASLAIQYLINNQQQDQYAEEESSHPEEESNAKN